MIPPGQPGLELIAAVVQLVLNLLEHSRCAKVFIDTRKGGGPGWRYRTKSRISLVGEATQASRPVEAVRTRSYGGESKAGQRRVR